MAPGLSRTYLGYLVRRKKMLLFLAVETGVAGVKRYFLLIFRDCWLSLLLQISLEIILEEADYY